MIDDHARVEETARDAAASHGPARTGRRRAGFGHSTPTPAPVRPESPIHGDSRTHIWWYTTYSTPLEQSLSIYIDHQPWCPGRPSPHPGGRRRRRRRRRSDDRTRNHPSQHGSRQINGVGVFLGLLDDSRPGDIAPPLSVARAPQRSRRARDADATQSHARPFPLPHDRSRHFVHQNHFFQK